MKNQDPDQTWLELALLLLALAVAVQVAAACGSCLLTDSASCGSACARFDTGTLAVVGSLGRRYGWYGLVTLARCMTVGTAGPLTVMACGPRMASGIRRRPCGAGG